MIKYYDKLDCIYDDTIFTSREFEFKSNSLDELLLKISKCWKYKRNSKKYPSLHIEISCRHKQGDEAPDIQISDDKVVDIYEAKRLLSENAIDRDISISPDLKEIYAEYMEISDGESSGKCYSFDYGILYGNYRRYKVGECVKSEYLYRMARYCWGKVKVPNLKFVIEGLWLSPNDKFFYSKKPTRYRGKHNFFQEISCVYLGSIVDWDEPIKEYNDSDIITYIDGIGEPIPVSTFYKDATTRKRCYFAPCGKHFIREKFYKN